ncbi:MAG TPA: branched-chain amino acid ABC transporter permease [Acidimicrobiales bacterium]|nr:branched-chain amino acid ABC transporter permease [Acidimicrobiales bacterium]
MKAVFLDGIVLGLQMGLLGVGLTLIYGLGGVLNLSHGQFAVLGAIVMARVLQHGASLWMAVPLGLLAAAAVAVLSDLTIMQPVYRLRGEARVLLGLLLMLGVGTIIDGYLEWKYPIEALNIRISGDPISIIGVPMRVGSLVASAIALAAGAALFVFLRYTTFGRATRSIIEDEEGARLCGINPALVRTLIFGLSGALAGLVAVSRAMTSPVISTAGVELTILALIVAVVGGLGSVSGAFVAGVLLGIVNTVSAFYIGTYITTIVLLAAAALTIVFRPAGILGRRA